MAANKLEIQLLLSGLATVNAGLQSLRNQVSSTFDAFKGMAAGSAAALAGFAGVAGLGAAIKRGVEFNSQLQQVQLGIAAVQKQMRPDVFKTFDQAMAGAASTLEQLKQQARESPATLQDLTQGFLGITGAATSAGIPLEEQTSLIVTMSQALAALGIQREQLLQESRALVTGTINHSAMAAQMLGITAAQVNEAKEQGKLYEFLMGRLSAFAEAGKKGAETWATVTSNLKDVVDQDLGSATDRLTELGAKSVSAMTSWLDAKGIGPQVDAWVRAFEDSWKKSQVPEFLALSIEAAFEMAGQGIAETFGAFAESLIRAPWASISRAIHLSFLSAWQEMMKAITWAAQPVAAFARWTADHLGNSFARGWAAFKQFAGEAINAVLAKLESFGDSVQKAFKWMTGGLVPTVKTQLPRIDLSDSAIPEAMTWEKAMAESVKAREEALRDIQSVLDVTSESYETLFGIEGGLLAVDGKRLTATQKLAALLKDFEQVKPPQISIPGGGPNTLPAFDAKKLEDEAKARLLELQTARARVEGDFTLTDAQKYERKVELIRQEREELEKVVSALQARQKLEPDNEQLRSRTDQFQRDLAGTDRRSAGLGADPNSLRDQMLSTITEIQNAFGTAAQGIARAFKTVVGGAVDGIAGGIKGLITQTMSWKEALQNIGSSVMNSITEAISRMFAEWIVGRALAAAKNIFFSQAEGQADVAAKAPGALMTSISSFGWASVAGLAALVAAIAAISGAFAEGGRPPSGRPALVGELGPELFVPDRPGTIVPADVTSEILAGNAGIASGGSGSKAQNVHVYIDRREWLNAIRDDVEGIAVEALRRRA